MLWPWSVCSFAAVLASQIIIVVSAEPEMRRLSVDVEAPVGMEAQRMHFTKSRWPFVKLRPRMRVSVSQDQTVRSQQPA